jgi:hypothetical protein
MGTLFIYSISLYNAFYLEYCKQLERERENHQQYITLRFVIHKLRNNFLNKTQTLYIHPQFLHCHNFGSVCGSNTDKRGYVTRNFVFYHAGYKS